MKQISGVDLYKIVEQLSDLKQVRIEKIYQQKDSFFLVVRKSGQEKKILAIILPSALFFSKQKPQMVAPSAFCAKLRKLFERAIITDIKQVELERILELTCLTKDGTKIVIIELFSKGNLIVCDQEKKIILPLKSQTWKDRVLKRGQIYKHPPKRSTPINTEKKEWTEKLLAQKLKSISGYLATRTGLGRVYAEKLCALAQIDPKAKTITQEQANALYDNFKTLLKNAQNPLEELEQSWGKDQEHKKPKNKKLDKINSIINQQEKSIADLKVKIQENKEKAQAIYAYYQQLTKIFEQAKTKNLKAIANNPLVKKINQKDKSITVELEQ